MKYMLSVIFIVFLCIGCASTPPNNGGETETDFIKNLVCEVKDGQYTGTPKPIAVSLIAAAIKLGAGQFDVPINDDIAKQISEQVLKAYCSGVIDDIFGGLDDILKSKGFDTKVRAR